MPTAAGPSHSLVPKDLVLPPKCAVCGNLAKLNCTTCKSTYYCTAKCQKNDLALHELLCEKYVSFIKNGPPQVVLEDGVPIGAISYKLAILFPEDSNLPELIWVKCVSVVAQKEGFDEPHRYDSVIQDICRYTYAPAPMSSIKCGNRVHIYVRNDIGHPKVGPPMVPNECYDFLNYGYTGSDVPGGSAAGPSRYYGNLVAIRCRFTINPKLNVEERTCHNITLADLRHAYEFLSRDNKVFESDQRNPYYLRAKGEWSRAVKISCSGDMKFMGKKKYRMVDIHSSHPIHHQPAEGAHKIPVSWEMGFPLLVQKMNIDPNWLHETEKVDDPYRSNNLEMQFLNVNISPHDKGFWFTLRHERWALKQHPTILVARQDKSELTTQHIESLALFLGVHVALSPYCHDDYDKFGKAGIEQITFNLLHSCQYELFFSELKAERVEGGDESWTNAAPLPRYPEMEPYELKQLRDAMYDE